MPSSRPPRLRRPVVVASAVLVGLVGLLLGPVANAAAFPYGTDAGPVLTMPDEATFVLGKPGDTYVIEADGDPVAAIGVDALPPGLRLVVHGDGSATIAGTPTGPAGITTVEVRAQSPNGATVEDLTVVVQQPPSFLDRGPVIFGVGQAGRVVVRTAGFPAPGIGLEGDLPGGLEFVDNGDGTATISGTPLKGPTSAPVTLTAVNVVADASVTTTVQVVVRPDAVPATTAQPPGPRREP